MKKAANQKWAWETDFFLWVWDPCKFAPAPVILMGKFLVLSHNQGNPNIFLQHAPGPTSMHNSALDCVVDYVLICVHCCSLLAAYTDSCLPESCLYAR